MGLQHEVGVVAGAVWQDAKPYAELHQQGRCTGVGCFDGSPHERACKPLGTTLFRLNLSR